MRTLLTIFFFPLFVLTPSLLWAEEPRSTTVTLSPPKSSERITPFQYQPSGVSEALARGDCQGEYISNIFSENPLLQTQVRELKSYFQRCGSDIATSREKHTLAPLIRFVSIHYHLAENPDLRLLSATLPDGRTIKGVMALKPDREPRPLVIVKCGVFCDTGESSNFTTSLMHLFDESPFHVVILANITGTDFERDNKSFAVGGFDEGLQLYELARYFRFESDLKNRFSSVQVMGISLGGHAALYSSLYSSQNLEPSGEKAIDAVLALCPVVSLENSLQRLYNKDLLSYGYTYVTFRNLLSFADKIPPLREALKRINGRRPDQMYALLTKASVTYYQRWTEKRPWSFHPFYGTQVTSLKQFWDLNDFTHYTSLIQVPTMVIAASNDDVVQPQKNAHLLPNDNPFVQVLTVPQGDHCAFAFANGYERWSRLLREYFVSNDPLWKNKRHSIYIDLTQELYGKGFFNRFRPSQFSYQLQSEWKVSPNTHYAKLSLKFFSYTASNESNSCLGITEYDADEDQAASQCIKHQSFEVPLSKILPEINETYPKNEYEAQRLTRILNTRSVLVDENLENYLRSQSPRPQYLKIEN